MKRNCRRLAVAVALATCGVWVATSQVASGNFSASTANTVSTITAETLQPPSGLAVSFHCALIGILRPVADLSWIATPSIATGYQLDRYKGAVLDNSTTVNGASTTTYSDGLGVLNLGLSTTYTWHLRTDLGSWVSSDAVLTASTPVLCT